MNPARGWLAALMLIAVAAPAPVARAQESARKPGIVFSLPDECPASERERCKEFGDSLAHPAMQRRLASFVVETVRAPDGAAPFISVRAPSGAEVIRVHGWQDWIGVSQIISRLELVTSRLLAADDALIANDPDLLDRHWTLALLTFGDSTRGRRLLESMLESRSAENRDLATLWLERMGRTRGSTTCEETLHRLATEGVTGYVRFEAWMAIGDLHMLRDERAKAVAAFDRAVALMPDHVWPRRTAIAARQRASTVSPLLGLGAPGAIVAGRRSIQPRAVPKRTASVEFKLDGKVVATAKRSPFIASVHFGRIPERRIFTMTFRDAGAKVLDRTTIVLNERNEAFAVELVEPAAQELSGLVDVVAQARVPRGRSVEELVIEWNGAAVARFKAPPYRTQIRVRSGEQGVLRALLRLDDGSESEDVRLANDLMTLETGAHLVEVPAYFEPTAPEAKDVIVREARVLRKVEQVIPPQDAPLLVALLIDSSSSMADHMLDVQEAAVRFIDEHLAPRDRVMLVAFDTTARILVHPTDDHELATRSLLSLLPSGATSLHDAIVGALMQLQASGSRKALIVFSDGIDVSSSFASRDVAEVARRAGVPIYVLSFDPGIQFSSGMVAASSTIPRAAERAYQSRKELRSIALATGGQWLQMGRLSELQPLWAGIGADLARQSLVIYRTESSGAEWRSLELTVKGKKRVRAPSGVYVTSETQGGAGQ